MLGPMKDDEPACSPVPREIAIADTLIFILRQARASLNDPVWGKLARAQIEAARSVLIDYGDAPYSRTRTYELLVDALDQSEQADSPLELRAQSVSLRLAEAIPHVEVPFDIIQNAVLLWPTKKQRTARSDAMRSLARVFDCDTPSLMTQIRQARARVRRRRYRRTT